MITIRKKLEVEKQMESIRIPVLKNDYVHGVVESLESRGFRYSATTYPCEKCEMTGMSVYYLRKEGKVVEGRLVCHSCGRSVPYNQWRPGYERYKHATEDLQ